MYEESVVWVYKGSVVWVYEGSVVWVVNINIGVIQHSPYIITLHLFTYSA